MLSPVSTWMGDRLGTLGAVGFLGFFSHFMQSQESQYRTTKRMIFPRFLLNHPFVKLNQKSRILGDQASSIDATSFQCRVVLCFEKI